METNLRIFLSHPWHLVFNTVSISFTVTACAKIHYIFFSEKACKINLQYIIEFVRDHSIDHFLAPASEYKNSEYKNKMAGITSSKFIKTWGKPQGFGVSLKFTIVG